MRYAAIFGVITACIGPATAQADDGLHIANRRAAVQAYVSTTPLATLADDVCPGMQADAGKLQVLRATANAFDWEEVLAFREMKKVEADAREAIAREGTAAWCREVWSLIGTNGSWVPGLLTRH